MESERLEAWRLGRTLQAPAAAPPAPPSRTLLPHGVDSQDHPEEAGAVPSSCCGQTCPIWCLVSGQDPWEGRGETLSGDRAGTLGSEAAHGEGEAGAGALLCGVAGQGLTGAVFAGLPGRLHPCYLLMALVLLPGTHEEQGSHAPQSRLGPPELAWHVGLSPNVPQMAPSTPTTQDSFPSRSRGCAS